MKKVFTTLCLTVFALSLFAQNGPGLLISEILANPAGTDSPFEFVELVATRTINFASTPYSVVVCNNGAATTAGWVAGGNLSYGFQINTGTVNAGDVVYVGGSSMVATGTILRAINTGTTIGDGFGNFNTGGVVGNGGGNADGVAVFDLPIASITNASGRLIVQQAFLGNHFQLDLTAYAAGCYAVQLVTSSGSIVKRLHKL
jgi:hypothetical protein